MTQIRVIKPGLLTTVQDLGRWGHQSHGVPVSGPMDMYAHRLANALVGNPAACATLEITMIGPELEFDDERMVVVTGAEFAVTAGGSAVPPETVFHVPAGARIRFAERRRGARAYLGIQGGIAVPPVLGSRATHVTSRMGGVEGRALRGGDRLPLGDGPPHRVRQGYAGQEARRHVSGHARVRILPGPQRDYFTDEAFNTLLSAPYTIGANSDRMGFRLEGPLLTHAGEADIISDATPIGALQVPASGQPILLMADRQTTGGYPKIGTVITADLDLAGQLGPGDTISFVACLAADALAALIARERLLITIERAEGAPAADEDRGEP